MMCQCPLWSAHKTFTQSQQYYFSKDGLQALSLFVTFVHSMGLLKLEAKDFLV